MTIYEQKGRGMNTGRLKDMLADVGDDMPVLVKTADGWKRVSIACEEVLWDEKTVPGNELEAFCIELYLDDDLEPYSVGESTDYFSVDRDDEELCLYWKNDHPHAKEAAEAECARLNAEHRKGEGK